MKIVPNTDTYQYTNLNPRGWHVGDCVVRALAYVIDKPYDQILRELTELAIKRSAGCPALPEGRRAGKTLANILRLIFESDEPITFSKLDKSKSDVFFIEEFIDVYRKLTEQGFKLRKVDVYERQIRRLPEAAQRWGNQSFWTNNAT